MFRFSALLRKTGPCLEDEPRRSAQGMDLSSYDAFSKHKWMRDVDQYYERRAALSEKAAEEITAQLRSFNKQSSALMGRGFLTAIEARVKAHDSYVRKLYGLISMRDGSIALTKDTLIAMCARIGDVCGARFCVAYSDEIEEAVRGVRKYLKNCGHGTDLASAGFPDRNTTMEGDECGYRSYHFYINVLTETDIYGDTDWCLCELQARSDLQHVWAVRSHDLVYKQLPDCTEARLMLADMKQIGNGLAAADHFLMRLRDQAAKGRSPQ